MEAIDVVMSGLVRAVRMMVYSRDMKKVLSSMLFRTVEL